LQKTDNCTKSVSINPRAFGAQSQSQNGHVATMTPGALSERRAHGNKRQVEDDSAVKDTARKVSFRDDSAAPASSQAMSP